MPGPIVGAAPSVPPSPNLALPPNTASQPQHRIESNAAQLSDRNRAHLENAALWGAADGVPDALQTAADVKIASESPTTKKWESAISDRKNGVENITLSSMSDILSDLFRDAKEQGCNEFLLVGAQGQVLLKQKEHAIEMCSMPHTGTVIEQHGSVDDRLTHSVLNSLYGKETAAQFPLRHDDHGEGKAADSDKLPESAYWTETEGAAESNNIYAYKVGEAEASSGQVYSDIELDASSALIPENGETPWDSAAYALPAIPVMNSTQVGEHMPAANDPYAHVHPVRDEEHPSAIEQRPEIYHPDIVRYLQSADRELQDLLDIKGELQKHLLANPDGDCQHYFNYVEAHLTKRQFVAEKVSEFKEYSATAIAEIDKQMAIIEKIGLEPVAVEGQDAKDTLQRIQSAMDAAKCARENLGVNTSNLINWLNALKPYDKVKQTTDKYFSQNQLVTMPRVDRPGFATLASTVSSVSSIMPSNLAREAFFKQDVVPLQEDSTPTPASIPVQANAAATDGRSLSTGSMISKRPDSVADKSRKFSMFALRTLSSPPSSLTTSMAPSIEPSEVIGVSEFQRMLRMFEDSKGTNEPRS